MRSSRCTFSASAALSRVFIPPIERHLPLQFPQNQPGIAFVPKYPRLVATQQRSYARPTTTPKRRLPRDEEIKSDFVHVVSEDGKLSPPQPTSRLLSSIDRKTHIIMTVAVPARDRHRYANDDAGIEPATSEGEPEEDEGPQFPIVKILARRDVIAAQLQKKKAENRSATVKKIEVNWAIDGHDLGHRLEKMKEFLRKGWRVEIMLLGKRKGKKATEEEAKAMLARIRGTIEEVAGSKEWKTMDGQVGTQATLYVEGKFGSE